MRGVRCALLLTVLLVTRPGYAVKVALLENYYRGQLVRLEPNGRFAHVAISVGDRYLHAHPTVGVQLTANIRNFGVAVEIYENRDIPEPTPEQVRRYLGMRYHPRLEWNENDGTTYSARLVGELLNIAPKPALYRAEIWENFAPGSSIGLSPDDIFDIITNQMGFRLPSCDEALVDQ